MPKAVLAAVLLIAPLLAPLAGCSSLPHDGPDASAVIASPGADYSLVDLRAREAQVIADVPEARFAALGDASSLAPVDLIGQGDALAISIYQASGALIGAASTVNENGASGAGATVLPRMVVDREGSITVPIGGRIRVEGLTPTQAATAIRTALNGKVVNPQVVVNVSENISNAVTVIGEVRNAGRIPLTANGDRLLDVMALAGGPTKAAQDLDIVLVRRGRSVSENLSSVMQNGAENIRLAPHDQLRIIYRPRKFSTFGAVGHAAQLPIEDETLTLAGAIGRVGGLDTNSANASNLFVFRFERPEVARALGLTLPPSARGVPVVYRVDLREPAGLFVANSFTVRPDDIVYASRAKSAELRKFFDMVGSISQVAYNVRVASVLH